MPHNYHPVDLQKLKDCARVPRHVGQVVGHDGLRGSAVADLVRDNNPETFAAKRVDEDPEVEAREVVAMKEHACMTIRLSLGRNVHVRHPDFLSIKRHRQVTAGVWVGAFLASDASGLYIGWWDRSFTFLTRALGGAHR